MIPVLGNFQKLFCEKYADERAYMKFNKICQNL